MSDQRNDPRALRSDAPASVMAPQLDYEPRVPKAFQPCIGLVGCGGISASHLDAYRSQGYRVVALCDSQREAAEARRREFCAEAEIYTDYRELLKRPDIDVVDLAAHPAQRVEMVRDSLLAGKHVLSQKPFVTDLAVGQELIALADRVGRKLAVNQNGRWAPYYSYLRQALQHGLLGEVDSVDIHIAWDHSWIQNTAFEKIRHVILYDFGIHWFDMVACAFGQRSARSVCAQVADAAGQTIAPPLNAHAIIRFDQGMATLSFRGCTRFAPQESTTVIGTKGVFRSSGPVCANDQVSLSNADGQADVELKGLWFNDGFAGAMGELLCSIEEDREPENSARANLRSLQLCFAAIASAEEARPIDPAGIQRLPSVT